MTDLVTLVEPLKRELAVPGLYDDVFPDTSDADLAGALADGFAEAQLQGFYPNMTLGPAPTYSTSSDLSAAGGALVVLFTGMRIIRAQLRSLVTSQTYKAGPVETQVSRSAQLLRDELAYMKSRIDDLVKNARKSGRAVYVLDNYIARNIAESPLGAFYGYEFTGFYGEWYQG